MLPEEPRKLTLADLDLWLNGRALVEEIHAQLPISKYHFAAVRSTVLEERLTSLDPEDTTIELVAPRLLRVREWLYLVVVPARFDDARVRETFRAMTIEELAMWFCGVRSGELLVEDLLGAEQVQEVTP